MRTKTKSKKKTKHNTTLWIFLSIAIALLFSITITKIADSLAQPNIQCTTSHPALEAMPKTPVTAFDYFTTGNYDYDTGNCTQAIEAYTHSLQIQPNDPQTYNNRAYTYMRMQKYTNALADLNQAIALNPNYIQALMNRGDLYNTYGPIIDKGKAIADYEKVVSLGGTQETSVCGHLFLAKHNGWNIGTIFALPSALLRPCD